MHSTPGGYKGVHLYCLKSFHQSKKSKVWFFLSCTLVGSTGNSYKTIFPIIILMIDHFGQSDDYQLFNLS